MLLDASTNEAKWKQWKSKLQRYKLFQEWEGYQEERTGLASCNQAMLPNSHILYQELVKQTAMANWP